jgi:hypothetical protein
MESDDVVDVTYLRRRISDLEAQIGSPVKAAGGGGTSGGMEPRVAKLEAAVEHIQRDTTDIKTDMRTLRDNARTDFRLLFSAIIVVALGLAGLMARGFHWL